MLKKEVLETIRTSIRNNDKAVIHALEIILSRQTYEEVRAERSVFSNNIGFSGRDAEILTSFALQQRSRGFLSPKQMAIARNKIVHYAEQLLSNALLEGKIVKHGRCNYEIVNQSRRETA